MHLKSNDVLLARFDLARDLLFGEKEAAPIVRVLAALGAQASLDLGQLVRRAEAPVGEAVLDKERTTSGDEGTDIDTTGSLRAES